MPPAIRQLSRLQVGRETARGTAVTPTRRLHYRSARQSVETDLDTFEDEDSGTIAASWYPPAVTGQGTGYVLEMPLDLRQALLGLLGSFEGQSSANLAISDYSELPGIAAVDFDLASPEGGTGTELELSIPAATLDELTIRGNAAVADGLVRAMLYGRPMQIVAAAAGNAVLHTFNIAAVARADQSDGVSSLGLRPWTRRLTRRTSPGRRATRTSCAPALRRGTSSLRAP